MCSWVLINYRLQGDLCTQGGVSHTVLVYKLSQFFSYTLKLDIKLGRTERKDYLPQSLFSSPGFYRVTFKSGVQALLKEICTISVDSSEILTWSAARHNPIMSKFPPHITFACILPNLNKAHRHRTLLALV